MRSSTISTRGPEKGSGIKCHQNLTAHHPAAGAHLFILLPERQENHRSPGSPEDELEAQAILSPFHHLLGSQHFDSARGSHPRRLDQTVALEIRDGCAVAIRRRIYGHGSEGICLEKITADYAAVATSHFLQDTPNPDEQEEVDAPPPSFGQGNRTQAVFSAGSPLEHPKQAPEPRSVRLKHAREL